MALVEMKDGPLLDLKLDRRESDLWCISHMKWILKIKSKETRIENLIQPVCLKDKHE